MKNTDQQQRWKLLSDWIQLKLNSNRPILDLIEIKVMLLLNIYYDYYCNNQLALINTLLELIENILELPSEELRVFRVLIQPERFMVGYPLGNNNNDDNNFLNNLFKLDCQDEFELSIRHMLVNLMAMILLGGKQSFLWTFAFQPSTLQNTFGIYYFLYIRCIFHIFLFHQLAH